MEYKVIESWTADSLSSAIEVLTERVNLWCEDDEWKPQGGIAIASSHIGGYTACQAIVKKKEKTS